MKYILSPNIALRSWQLVPRAYYNRFEAYAHSLSQEDFDILRRCDGIEDIPPSPALDGLVQRGLCTPAENGETLSEWQQFRFCDNRYFPSVDWAITGKCNFNCRHCFNAADNSPLMSEFTREQSMDFVRRLDECGVQNIALTGGEPMLYPHFMEVCREIYRRGMVVDEIVTNGSFITSEVLDEFDSFGHSPLFKLSLDGIGHHDWFRDRDGAQREVIEKLQLLVDRGYPTLIQTNVHRGNVESILPTVKLADTMGVDGIRVIRTTEAPRWAEKGGDLCLDITEYYDFALGFVRDFLEQGMKIDVDIWQVFQMWPKRMEYHHRPIEGGMGIYRDSLPVCRGNRGRIGITPEGDAVPCNQMSGLLKLLGKRFGNVHETPLNELLADSEYLESVTLSVGELLQENPKCQACPHWKLCLGGCRAIGMLFGGKYESHDPAKCVYFDHYLDKFAALFDKKWRCVDDI